MSLCSLIKSRNVAVAVEAHLLRLAKQELPPRCFEFAARHDLSVARVSVRNQRSRWGSCSPRRAIMLNWRLVQMPPDVRDYILWHELMHLRQPNHSIRFWREVERVVGLKGSLYHEETIEELFGIAKEENAG